MSQFPQQMHITRALNVVCPRNLLILAMLLMVLFEGFKGPHKHSLQHISHKLSCFTFRLSLHYCGRFVGDFISILLLKFSLDILLK